MACALASLPQVRRALGRWDARHRRRPRVTDTERVSHCNIAPRRDFIATVLYWCSPPGARANAGGAGRAAAAACGYAAARAPSTGRSLVARCTTLHDFLSACDVLSLVCRALACPSLLRTPLPPQAARPSLRTAGAAAVDAVPISQLSEAERTTLAEQWGYKSIGAELPNDVTLTDIVKTLPAEARAGRGDHWHWLVASTSSLGAQLSWSKQATMSLVAHGVCTPMHTCHQHHSSAHAHAHEHSILTLPLTRPSQHPAITYAYRSSSTT